jgi:hypothetical protein
VDEIEVNLVGIERTEAGLQTVAQPGSTGVADVLVTDLSQATFGRQHQFLPFSLYLRLGVWLRNRSATPQPDAGAVSKKWIPRSRALRTAVMLAVSIPHTSRSQLTLNS